MPFAGFGKIMLFLIFKRFDLETVLCKTSFFWSFLWTLPTTRQSTWSFGCCKGCVAVLAARWVVLSAPEKVGREVLMSASEKTSRCSLKHKKSIAKNRPARRRADFF